MPTKYITGHIGVGFNRSNNPANSGKALRENRVMRIRLQSHQHRTRGTCMRKTELTGTEPYSKDATKRHYSSIHRSQVKRNKLGVGLVRLSLRPNISGDSKCPGGLHHHPEMCLE